ncbi:unnamed protein product, partial [Iphiclides podalirius]
MLWNNRMLSSGDEGRPADQSAGRASSGGGCIPTPRRPRPAAPSRAPRPSGARHVTCRLAAECATATKIERAHTISHRARLRRLSRLLSVCCLTSANASRGRRRTAFAPNATSE